MLMDVVALDWHTAEQIERGINRFSTAFDYTNAATKLGYNLSCNKTFITEYPLDELASLTDECMASALLKKFQEEERERSLAIMKMLKEKYDNVNSIEVRNSDIKCGQCGSVDISWQQKQTRGADEAMTIFCTCVSCGHRWKMS